MFRFKQHKQNIPRVRPVVLFLWLFAVCVCSGQLTDVIEVRWKRSAVFPVAGITRAVVFDENVCRIELLPDGVRVTGLTRGETIALLWTPSARRTIIVRITEPEEKRAPTLMRRADGTRISGFLGTTASQSKGASDVDMKSLANRLSWQEAIGTGTLGIHSDTIMGTRGYPGKFNFNTAAIEYSGPTSRWSLMDSILNLTSSSEAVSNPLTSVSNLVLRGFQYSKKSGSLRYTAFAGATLPPYFLNFSGTSDLTGARIEYEVRPRVSMFFTQALVSTLEGPAVPFGTGGRRLSWMQLTGVSARLSHSSKLNVTAGASNRGFLVDSAINYDASQSSAWLSGRYAGVEFPLNRLHLLASGKVSASAGAHKVFRERVDSSILFQHTSIGSSPFVRSKGSTDYFHGSLSFVIASGHRVSTGYIVTRTSNSLVTDTNVLGSRVNIDVFTRLGGRVSNSFRIARGALRDPFQFNSQSDASVRNTLNLRIARFSNLSFQVSQDKVNPSFLARVSQNVSLLAPSLQQMFLQDPASFIGSPSMPDSLRALLTGLQPGNLQGTIEAQWRLGPRIDLSTSLGHFLERMTTVQRNRTRLYGFNANVRLTSGLDLTSSLSETYLYVSGGLRRMSVMTIGINKRLNRTGRGLHDVVGARRSISGRVFRDANASGTYNLTEAGFPGMRVYLNNGQTAVTDSEGRFRFSGLRASVYTVTLPINQFGKAIRVTTAVEREIDLSVSRTTVVDFGIIDQSRVRGAVFNDYQMTGIRQLDAPPVPHVRLILRGDELEYEATSTQEGEYEFERVVPGEYSLLIDRATLPEDFETAREKLPVHVVSAQTANVDVPILAHRSLAGRVVYQASSESVRVPLPNVQLAAGPVTAITSPTGAFLLRRLPAGDIRVSLVPPMALPAGKQAPSGVVRLGRAPFAGTGMEIVISDPELASRLSVSGPPLP